MPSRRKSKPARPSRASPSKKAKPHPKAKPKPSRPAPKPWKSAKPAKTSKPSAPAKPSAPKSAEVPPPPVRVYGDERRHVLSLAFLRDGDEFMARLETDGGQITELKNRSLDQLLTLVAGELEDLLE